MPRALHPISSLSLDHFIKNCRPAILLLVHTLMRFFPACVEPYSNTYIRMTANPPKHSSICMGQREQNTAELGKTDADA